MDGNGTVSPCGEDEVEVVALEEPAVGEELGGDTEGPTSGEEKVGPVVFGGEGVDAVPVEAVS